ncbi:DUF3298 and DUF4163 domain-containing protein [Cytobacillus purgationiresistens]|uniref:Anti-sigma factor n=1 Tax=Cytobacillus purgationiresistens TaxID=863449 RepID=A0ABU0ARV6_9BACI|nr:DUF3298 and DUF4163 domain-containing protein [Cytobacillus purgationiresistens]MDQ0272780.1 hypothetical protein [Cytobacillus purgationiresistens]
MNEHLKRLKKEYKDVPIPVELDKIVASTLKPEKRKPRFVWSATAAAAAILFTATVNLSPAAAESMSKIPIVKEIVEVITFNEIKEENNHSSIDVKTPAISGLENKTLEDNLNQSYIDQSQKLYEEFTNSEGHLAIESDYKVMIETPELLSIQLSTFKAQASGYTENQYITIDKENEALVTLQSLFNNNQYLTAISENIKAQMTQQMEADDSKIYWIAEDDMDPFTKITADQSFYISKDRKLVISFNEYEVAPGYMGAVEFEIPTDVIESLLVGDRYVK